MTHNTRRLVAIMAWIGLLTGMGCEYHTQAPGTNEALEEKIKALQDQIADNSVKVEGVGEINEGPQTITPTETDTADTTPPSVLKVSPNGIGSWGLLKAIVIEFDEVIDIGSLNKADALLLSPSPASADSPLILSIVTGDGNKRLTLILSGPLQSGTPYTAVLQAKSIKDLAGNAMTGDYAWSFTIPALQEAPVSDGSSKACATYEVVAHILMLEKKVGTLSEVDVITQKNIGHTVYTISGVINIDSESKYYPIGTITKATAYTKYKSGQLYPWKPLVPLKGSAYENGCVVKSDDKTIFACTYSTLDNPDLGAITELRLSFESPTSHKAIIGIESKLPAIQELMSCVP